MTDLHIITEPLGGSPIAAAAVRRDAPPGWFVATLSSKAVWQSSADATRKEAALARWLTVLEPAFDAAGPALERLQRSANGAGVVITTGQQPGAFGGPLYTLSKALSALAFADALQDMIGIPVAPVFWAATDDADIAEANSTTVSMTGGPRTIHLPSIAPAGTPMSLAPLGDVRDALAMLSEAAGSGSHARYLEIVRSAYEPSSTVGGAYVKVMRALLEPLGIAVLDASHAAVRDAGDELMRRALASSSTIDEALKARTGEIQKASWSPQVPLVKGLSLVFALEQGVKRRLPIKEADRAASSSARGSLSPNVLLRPLLERAILPTAGYVAGPGEIAYFAQVTAVADALGASCQVVLPRWSGTVIEPHIARLLERYGLQPDDLRDPHAAETGFARSEAPREVMSTLNELRDDVSRRLAALSAAMSGTSPLIPRAVVDGAGKTLQHRLDRLERRIVAAQKRRSESALVDIATARGALFPNGKRQERALNAIPMLTRHGSLVLDGILEAARVHARATVSGADLPVGPAGSTHTADSR